MTPSQLTIALNAKWLRQYGASSMCGNCGKLSSMLRDALTKRGIKGYIASGTITGFPGLHAWVVCDGQILDPSISQFGDYPPVGSPLIYNEQRRMEF